jgi:hypothetical protein
VTVRERCDDVTVRERCDDVTVRERCDDVTVSMSACARGRCGTGTLAPASVE